MILQGKQPQKYIFNTDPNKEMIKYCINFLQRSSELIFVVWLLNITAYRSGVHDHAYFDNVTI